MLNPVQVFLDEVNTSCCLGLLKEIIVDRTLDGKVGPECVHGPGRRLHDQSVSWKNPHARCM